MNDKIPQVVMNTGTMITEARLTDGVGDDVIWNVLENSREKMEETFGKVKLPSPLSERSKRNSGSKSKPGAGKQKKKGLFGGVLGSLFGGGGSGDGGRGDGSKNKKRKAIEGTPPEAPAHVKGRAAFMVHGAARMSYEVGGTCRQAVVGGGEYAPNAWSW